MLVWCDIQTKMAPTVDKKKANRRSVPIDAIPFELRPEKHNRCGSHDARKNVNREKIWITFQRMLE